MTDSIQTAAIMRAGMKVLRETLGIIDAEVFISVIKNPGLDYTKWRENLWEDLTLCDLLERAARAEDKYGVPKSVEVL